MAGPSYQFEPEVADDVMAIALTIRDRMVDMGWRPRDPANYGFVMQWAEDVAWYAPDSLILEALRQATLHRPPRASVAREYPVWLAYMVMDAMKTCSPVHIRSWYDMVHGQSHSRASEEA